MQMEFDALPEDAKECVRKAAAERARAQRPASPLGMILILVVFAIIVLSFLGCSAHAGETPIYGPDGKYQGSVHDYGRTRTYTDRNGHFTGSAINQGNGTTSFYGPRGKSGLDR